MTIERLQTTAHVLLYFIKGSFMSANSVVLITGASRGIGAATAIYFARHGYDVCIN